MLPREVAIALALGVSMVAIVGAVLLLSGDSDDEGSADLASFTPGPTFSPANADEAAIAALAEKSIDVLPRNQWPALYDEFTSEFQARCPRDQFVQAGIEAAQEQGANLTRLGYVRLEDLSIEGDRATATIIGAVEGSFEYEVLAAFALQDGTWKLSADEGTSGCQAFNRP